MPAPAGRLRAASPNAATAPRAGAAERVERYIQQLGPLSRCCPSRSYATPVSPFRRRLPHGSIDLVCWQRKHLRDGSLPPPSSRTTIHAVTSAASQSPIHRAAICPVLFSLADLGCEFCQIASFSSFRSEIDAGNYNSIPKRLHDAPNLIIYTDHTGLPALFKSYSPCTGHRVAGGPK
jgi:hypothetical protein